jgi:glycine oxidase
MLAPNAEVGFEEIDFLKFGEKSLALYPQFLAELKADSDIDVPLDPCGTLMIGLDRDDAAYLKRLYEFRKQLGLAAEWVGASTARDWVELLSPKVSSAMWLPTDAQIDNRALVGALRTAFVRQGGALLEQESVIAINLTNKSIALESQKTISSKKIALAAGAWSREIKGLENELRPPIRPVKGQILTLAMTADIKLSRVIRSPRVYIAPKFDGRLVVGATTEEKGFDETLTAGGVLELLQEAYEAVPSIYELPLLEARAGLRPASRDNEPMIGESAVPNFYYAVGHYRHGILLAPATAYEMTAHILGEPLSAEALPFEPKRFSKLDALPL